MGEIKISGNLSRLCRLKEIENEQLDRRLLIGRSQFHLIGVKIVGIIPIAP
ncbi:hypothetical protein DSOL_5446 [Desulfosporosinus metallidurans]|uniref:Uncharacterized protein n=1 Tax=Desulfosporosinus metallidurans TaxID=1888891 RepID=A0A1Q8QAE3_9FIRM|nr:hypothetical protein DSOL_5446 [Desulfosporosinus metallidurans]